MATSDKFLAQNNILIPLIQRDYVQGADRNENRESFICALLGSLKGNDRFNLNFIYGSTVSIDKQKTSFVPLDGQQRLTTLCLLGWLLLQDYRLGYDESLPGDKEKRESESSEWREALRISYEARESSTEFCERLFPSNLDEWTEKPSVKITDQIWFAESWRFDPTVSAMLEMLDATASILSRKDEQGDIIWNPDLLAPSFFESSKIEFEYLDLSNNPANTAPAGLSSKAVDDLYVKINARGKHLTEFENWKACFIDLLQKAHGEGLKAEFENKIENDWCDVFWSYAIGDEGKVKGAYPRIDEYFMRFFDFATNTLLNASKKGGENYYELSIADKRKLYSELYKDSKNVEALFSVLDALVAIKKNGEIEGQEAKCAVDQFFNRYLYVSRDCDTYSPDERRVNLFETDNGSPNLFEILIRPGEKNKDMKIRPQLMLWGLLRYVGNFGLAPCLQQFARIWWGYLMNRRQRLTQKRGYPIEADISYEDYAGKDKSRGIITDLDSLLVYPNPDIAPLSPTTDALKSWYRFNRPSILYAHRKRYFHDIVPLLNHPCLLYDVHSLEKLIFDAGIGVGEVYKWFIDEVMSLDRVERIRTLLRHGFSGAETKNKNYRTFGLCGNWSYIFTDESALVDPLCNLYHGIEAPHENWLSKFVDRYADFLQRDVMGAFQTDGKYRLFSIPNGLSNRRSGCRPEPFSYVVVHKINPKLNDFAGWLTEDVEVTYYSEDSTHYGICFKAYGVQLECMEDGWAFKRYKSTGVDTLPVSLKSWLDTTYADYPMRDRVETGIFLTRIILMRLGDKATSPSVATAPVKSSSLHSNIRMPVSKRLLFVGRPKKKRIKSQIKTK